jgi:hypothetical protein
MACRLHRPAIAARLAHLREIDRTPFWEFCNTICHNRTHAPQYGSLIAAVFFGLAPCGPGHFDGLRSTSMVAVSRSISRNRRSEADSHPTDPPAMAVPETLRHPFATAKIVRPGTWIVARSRDACSNATLRACRRRGERTSDRCDRDEGRKCLLHSRPSCR